MCAIYLARSRYGFNSILIDRGDRVSIQGDGHPTMAAALSAFGSPDTYNLVHEMLQKTDSGCANSSACHVVDSGLMTYPMYWASSVNDWCKSPSQFTVARDVYRPRAM